MNVSVVIPCYNAEPFLDETLQSVVQQTIRPREVLLVDDGSTDSSRDVAARYAPLVRVIAQKNCGESVARNRGIDQARGDWIAFLDADDLWCPEKLERQLSVIQNGAACEQPICVHTGYFLFGTRDHSPREPAWSDQTRFDPAELILWPRVFVSSALVSAGLPSRFPQWTRAGEDMIYFAEICQHGSFAYVVDQLVGYRRHDRQQHVSGEHMIRHAESRLQWCRTQFTEQDFRELKEKILRRLVWRMKRLKAERHWRDYWIVRQYLQQAEWDSKRPAILDEHIYAPLAYQLKDSLLRAIRPSPAGHDHA